MGLFDFFRKKPSEKKPSDIQDTQATDNNLLLLETLRNRLAELGYRVDRHPQYLALIVNSELEIATVIIDNSRNHQSILHLMILTIHPKYFPNGIEENIVGIGESIQDKVNSVIDNYINTTFLPIIDSFSDSHNPKLDFLTTIDGKETLWHPKLGKLALQGQWNNQPQNEPLFEIIKDKLKNKLTSNKLNWVKLYISKGADGTIIGECNFNNQAWKDGLDDIKKYAVSWEMKSNFQGLKQFIMFRKCDAYDD